MVDFSTNIFWSLYFWIFPGPGPHGYPQELSESKVDLTWKINYEGSTPSGDHLHNLIFSPPIPEFIQVKIIINQRPLVSRFIGILLGVENQQIRIF
jgi:hypothetical protein